MTETINLIISLTTELLSKFPDYDQRKKNQFYVLSKAYQEELTADYRYRDDNKIDILRDDLKAFSRAFLDEIRQMEGSNE